MAFGQGVAVTAVQMASVYATIANGGVRVQPSLVAGTTTPAAGSRRPRSPPAAGSSRPATARELMAILQQVPYLDATLAYQPWGEIPGLLDRVKDRDRPDRELPRLPVPVRVELHRHRPGQRPETGGGGQRAEPA